MRHAGRRTLGLGLARLGLAACSGGDHPLQSAHVPLVLRPRGRNARRSS